MMRDAPAFARGGRTDAGGKLTARIDVPVSTELDEAVSALATIAGMPKSEWVRRLLERAVFGELTMIRRVSGLAGSVQSDEYPTMGGGA